MRTPRPTLTQLAENAAAQIGFTVRRWWRDAIDPTIRRVEVERRLVGAPPAIAELRVPLPTPARAQRPAVKAPTPPTRSRSRAARASKRQRRTARS